MPHPNEIRSVSPHQNTVDQICFAAYGLMLFLLIGYSTLGSNFSEIHIKLFFLEFPIFIGELILFALIALAFAKGCFTGVAIKKRTLMLIVLFLIFVIAKALSGYSKCGPLALRNAAMFYYVLYGLLAYYFYQSKLLSNLTAIILSLLFCAVPVTPYFRSYFLFTYLVFLVFFVQHIRSIKLRLLIVGYIFLFYPFQQLFEVSRGAFLANVAAVMYVSVTILFTIPSLKGRRLVSLVAFLGTLFLLTVFCMNEVSKKRLAAIFDFERWQTQYGEVMNLSKDRLSGYQPKEFDIKVYEPNTSGNIGIGGAVLQQQKQESLEWRQATKGESNRLSNQPISNEIHEVNTTTEHKVLQLSLDSVAVSKTIVELEASSAYENPRTVFSAFVKAWPTESLEVSRDEAVLQNAKSRIMIKNREDQSRSSLVWRVFLWNDIFDEFREQMLRHPALLLCGFEFGKPIRSKRQEAILLYLPQITGWLEPHNFVIHVIYRSGFLGIVMLIFMAWLFWRANVYVAQLRDWQGILLLGVLVYWIVFAMTMVVLELPHYAICFWSFCGFIAARISRKVTGKI